MDNKNKKQRAQYGKGCIFLRGGIYYYKNLALGILKKSLGTRNHKEAVKFVEQNYLPLKHLKTKEEVLLQFAQAKNLITKKSLPLDQVWNKFEKNPSRSEIGAETLQNYKARLNKFLKWLKANHPHITDMAQITGEISKEYASYLWEQKLAAKTFNDYMVQLGIMLRYTLGEEAAEIWAEKNIARHTPQHHSRKELNEDEFSRLFDMFKKEDYKIDNKEEIKVLFHIGAFTGLRLKDCALLKWDHVNLSRNLISVIPYKTKAKTNQRVNIPLHSELKAMLKLAQGWNKNDYVLPNVSARYIKSRSSFTQSCCRVFKSAGFEVQGTSEVQRQNDANDYGFSSFRHSFVSFCANAGVPLPVVQSIVGHSSTAITRFYIHIGEGAVRKAINSLPGSEKVLSADEKLIKILQVLKSDTNLTDREKKILEILN